MSDSKDRISEYIEFFSKLDRSEFLSGEAKMYADLDCPLSIGFGQTISQPTLVLEMTIFLELDKSHKVLEIGTGSGYQTAFLANFAKEVYTVEIYEELSKGAQEVLKKLNYTNVQFKIGDGSKGWEENSPYDRIIVTAAAGKMPDKLIEQLSPGGKLMVPLGSPSSQQLLLVEKDKHGKISQKVLNQVRFVEFVGEYGWR